MKSEPSQAIRRWFTTGPGSALLCLLLALLCSFPAAAIDLDEAGRIPHINQSGRDAFIQFLFAGQNRAFAISPGGAWAWVADEGSGRTAADEALRRCQSDSRRKCVLYAVDDEVVFNHDAWPTLWGPYQSRETARQAPLGTAVGQRFPDLVFNTETGQPTRLSALQGKVVMLHFWGSWCPYCCREMPELLRLDEALGGRQDITIVPLQVRESFRQSQQWIAKSGLHIQLYDSGVTSGEETQLSLAGGGKIEDRELARHFPSTYVLDGNGIVVYTRQGAARDWLEYLPFLYHTAGHTAREPDTDEYSSPLRQEPQLSGHPAAAIWERLAGSPNKSGPSSRIP